MRRLGLGIALVFACSERPVPGESDGGSSSGGEPGTTGAGPGTTGDPSPTTSGPPTTTETTETTAVPGLCGAACPAALVIEDDVVIDAAGGDFTCVTEVMGNLRVDGDADPSVVATLANLQRIAGTLTVRDQADFTGLPMFACLQSVGDLILRDMPQLTDLSALGSLAQTGALTLENLGITALPSFAPAYEGTLRLFLSDNSQLADVSALEGWIHPLFAVTIRSSPELADLSPLGPRLSASTTGQNIALQDLPAVTSLAALSELTDVDGLSLVNLPGVTDLSPLAGITEAGWLVLDGMPGVTTLAGLGGLTKLDNVLSIGACGGAPGWTG
ncbi:hypothetical protein OV079_19135 [Nannocystis pusilla]|uniref:Uncharacterized protein n=1 Tax=Nannocystis pusilla TaxID=889268 RepID=A0A9X3EPM1_9BACT|nr:hypothetical protein [Nannocystis pusilla]MCY1007625.1 hypothetical protein [Nannocystis pusilla]